MDEKKRKFLGKLVHDCMSHIVRYEEIQECVECDPELYQWMKEVYVVKEIGQTGEGRKTLDFILNDLEEFLNKIAE